MNMSYYAKLNENAWQHEKFRAETAEMLLRMLGYEANRIVNGDSSRAIVSEVDKQYMLKRHQENEHKLKKADEEFKQAKAKYESEIA